MGEHLAWRGRGGGVPNRSVVSLLTATCTTGMVSMALNWMKEAVCRQPGRTAAVPKEVALPVVQGPMATCAVEAPSNVRTSSSVVDTTDAIAAT